MLKTQSITEEILALEPTALDRWGKGDPSGYLEISAPEVVYLDPFQPRPLVGLEALSRVYEELRGKVRIDRDEILDPQVQVFGDVALLAFTYVSHTGEETWRWHCTEVYGRQGGAWRILQTHWSLPR